MKNKALEIIFASLIVSFFSCQIADKSETMNEATWKLGWRMIENYWDENYDMAEMQFDSLLALNKPISERFLTTGLEIKIQLSKEKEVLKIFENESEEIQRIICEKQFAKDFESCIDLPKEIVENKELQMEIIELFVKDQAIRGNMMQDIILKYQIDSSTIKREYDRTNQEEVNVDEENRKRLKKIIKENGFPTRKLVGKEAMLGVFLIIQHADGDTVWQRSLIESIALAAKKGDLGKPNYAFLYDRIQVNAGEKQRYGSQFSNVDRKNNVAELRETEDLANLNQRRREMEMMPIETYKRLILKDR